MRHPVVVRLHNQNSKLRYLEPLFIFGQGSRGSKYNLIKCDNASFSWMLRLKQTLL